MMRISKGWLACALATIVLAAVLTIAGSDAARAGEERFVVLASTTSTENSGLLDHLIPLFKAKTGIAVRTVVRGTGQAIRLAESGDADVLLVHHRPSEERFVAEGHGVARHDLMYNDFVLIGPAEDPARISQANDVGEALARIAGAGAPFASRGDDSGTHKKELELWANAGVEVAAASGGWYREMGSGMGATLNGAAAMAAYALTDRATWISFQNKAGLKILFEGEPRLFNRYGVILANPERHPHIKAEEGQALIDWLLSSEGQAAIAAFRVGGQQLFFPNDKS